MIAPMRSDLAGYLGVVVLITVTPGADTAIVVRNAVRHGRRAGLLTAIGSATGLLVWGAAAALGVAALLAASATLFTALKIVGAAYLVLLGLQALRHAGEGRLVADARGAARSAPPVAAAVRQGLLTNLLNPKAALFFTALLPQFVSPADPVLAVSALMTAIASAASLIGLTAYASAAAAGRHALQRPAVARRLDQLAGAVFIALGIRIALERR
jgi:RhtB (resistance to homoserine/threonine) family protein